MTFCFDIKKKRSFTCSNEITLIFIDRKLNPGAYGASQGSFIADGSRDIICGETIKSQR